MRTTEISNSEHAGAGREVKFSVALRPQKPSGLLGTGSPGRLLRLSHSS